MANLNEEIVREFFEQNGFSVKTQGKYTLTGSDRSDLEQIDLLVYNTGATAPGQIQDFILSAEDVKKIERAVVDVRGWHTEIFSPGVLQSSPELFYFAGLDAHKISERFFHGQSFINLLVLPTLPQSRESRQKSIEILRGQNISCVLEFRTILRNLIEQVQVNRNYAESNVLQILRILKKHDLLRHYQLELFED